MESAFLICFDYHLMFTEGQDDDVESSCSNDWASSLGCVELLSLFYELHYGMLSDLFNECLFLLITKL